MRKNNKHCALAFLLQTRQGRSRAIARATSGLWPPLFHVRQHSYGLSPRGISETHENGACLGVSYHVPEIETALALDIKTTLNWSLQPARHFIWKASCANPARPDGYKGADGLDEDFSGAAGKMV